MYNMKPKGIKRIMQQEMNEKFQDIINVSPFHKELLFSMKRLVMDQLENCATYEELENFCYEYCKMSLTEWVESL